MQLTNRHFLKLLDFEPEEIAYLLRLSAHLKASKKNGTEEQYLKRKNIVLLFEKDSTRTRCAFEVAAYDQGACTTYLGPSGSQIGKKESMADTARVLSRLYDAIEYRGFGQEIVETLAKYSSVPVYNGLTDEFHPTQVLADFMTMLEHCPKPLHEIRFAYLGDGRFNMGNSLMIGAAKMGMDFRSISPKNLQTSAEIQQVAASLAKQSGASIKVTDDVAGGVEGCDFLYTDVWFSMGEDKNVWEERIQMLKPYQITQKTMQLTGNPHCKFLHCLPAFHNRETSIGEEVYTKFGIEAMEVDDSVFESPANVAFDEAENRLHTIKAVMVATLAKDAPQV